MAESQKTATPSAKAKEKSSLLDIDIGKDFFSSWKSTSVADDGMDFDFGSADKGKKKAFKFDKMDMDFNLDADFDKSFKIDMPGLDISSPIKSSRKSKERSNEESSGGGHRVKRDSFAFKFDFDDFGDLNFESRKTKIDEKSKDKEEYSNTSGSGGFGDLLAKNIGASQDDDTSSKHPESKGVDTSKVDTQMGNTEDPDPRNTDGHLKSLINESHVIKTAIAEEQEIQRTFSSEKIISNNIQGSHLSAKKSSPEPYAQQVVQDDNISTEGTASDVQDEESRTMVNMVSSSTDNVRSMAGLAPINGSLLLENLSVHTNSTNEKGEMSKSKDNDVLIGRIDGDDTSKADAHLESSMTLGIESVARGATVDKRNEDSVTKLHLESLGSGTTIDELVPEKERANVPSWSKYFKKQNGSESELQQASLSRTNLISVGNKRTSTIHNNPALEKKEFGSIELESSSKFTGISRSLPKVLSRGIPVQTENTEAGHVKGLDNTRDGLNADSIKTGSQLVAKTVIHDTGATTEELVSRGSDQNTEKSNTHRSNVHPSSAIEQSKKIIPQNFRKPGLQVTRKTVVEENNTSPGKDEVKASEVSTLRVSRAIETKLKPLSSLLPKDLTTMKNKEQGNMALKRNPSVVTKKQTPPTPSLKRKTFEESADMPSLTPLKRLSASPNSNNIKASSENIVDKQVFNHATSTPRLNISLTEMDISSTIENEGYVEKAEACSKELEDICNMLKKKHEEAKDILVRAIVNNNNLLMLNHPIYQDKIRMVQKFAASLMAK